MKKSETRSRKGEESQKPAIETVQEMLRQMTTTQRVTIFFAFLGVVLAIFVPRASIGFRFFATLGYIIGFIGAGSQLGRGWIYNWFQIEMSPLKFGSMLLLLGGVTALTAMLIFPAESPYMMILGFGYWYWVLLFLCGVVNVEMGFVGLLINDDWHGAHTVNQHA